MIITLKLEPSEVSHILHALSNSISTHEQFLDSPTVEEGTRAWVGDNLTGIKNLHKKIHNAAIIQILQDRVAEKEKKNEEKQD